MEIKNLAGKVLFESKSNNLKEILEEAISCGADLRVTDKKNYIAYISSTYTRIGCRCHKSDVWLGYQPSDVKKFSSDAEKWWTLWGDIIKDLIKIQQKLFPG